MIFCWAVKLPFISKVSDEWIIIFAPSPKAFKSPNKVPLSPGLSSISPLCVSIVPPTPK